jgi:hypothetical protein
MKLVGNWNYPTSIRFGNGRVSELAAAVKSTGIARPLLVTDPRLAEMPMVARKGVLGDPAEPDCGQRRGRHRGAEGWQA